MNVKCLFRGHDWKTVSTQNLKPKPDGALKLRLENFVPCDLGEATYAALFKRCAREGCGKTTTEII